MGLALYRDMIFCVVTTTLQCETKVYCDIIFLYRDRVGSFGVATQSLWCCDKVGLAELCWDRARDMTVLSCGTLHCVVQLFELQCSYTAHEHCS